MKIGYARVSTEDQKLDLQLAALERAGCEKVFRDHGVSGAVMRRPGLCRTLRSLRRGQTLVVWRLDRLGRSLSGLVRLIDDLGERGIGFQSLTESIDTVSSGGRLVFHIMAALAEFERTLISERTRAGIDAARHKGIRLGRPPALDTAQIERAWLEVHEGCEPLEAVAARHRVSARTLQRQFKAMGARMG